MTERATVSSASAVALWIVAVVATVFLLRAATTLLIPIALAVLISYALAPVVSWLERHRVPRLAGAGLVLLVILGKCGGGAYALRDDARQLASTLPTAVQRARQEVLSRLGTDTEAIQEATKALGAKTQASGGAGPGEEADTSGQTTSSLVQRAVGAMFSLAGHLIVIFFLVYFLLISGHHVRNRLIEIAGPDPARRRTASTIIDDINAQTQRYLLVLLVTAVVVGVATWATLAWMRRAACGDVGDSCGRLQLDSVFRTGGRVGRPVRRRAGPRRRRHAGAPDVWRRYSDLRHLKAGCSRQH